MYTLHPNYIQTYILMLMYLTSNSIQNKKAQLSLTNPRDAKACKIAPIRRAYNVVADNTGLSSCV